MAISRSDLDRLTEHYALTPFAVDGMIDLAGARPSPAEARRFIARCLAYAGVLSLAAGVVFFVAANWSAIAVMGRFALLEIVLLACAGVGLVKPPPDFIGRAALFLAFIASGALLALFGQTYQTGADVYELFLAWSMLGLPFVIAGQWSATSAAWVLVLNTGLMLFCGWNPTGGLLWVIFSGARFSIASIVLAFCVLNLVLWLVFDLFETAAVPPWVRRLIVSCAFAFGAWGGILAIAGGNFTFERHAIDTLPLLGLAVAMIGVTLYTVRRRVDVYPLSVVTGTFILVGLVLLLRVVHVRDMSMFLLMAIWLIVTSTIGGRLLAKFTREWRAEGGA